MGSWFFASISMVLLQPTVLLEGKNHRSASDRSASAFRREGGES